jgi:VanZ family protein
LIVLTHTPVDGPVVAPIPYADKAYHFTLFFVLTWLGGRHTLCLRPRAPASAFLVWAVVYVCYAALDEWTQPLFDRTASPIDWLSDLTGILAATVVLVWRRRSASISPSTGSAT